LFRAGLRAYRQGSVCLSLKSQIFKITKHVESRIPLYGVYSEFFVESSRLLRGVGM
jgi:hypothetical protein